ncbi:uncharacterized protein LOC134788845 [Penaeus indicus]|uniref:uncharacterized protein LOC134788845 n=1 Tax=Penaeus indicus TaxID=29960 RepID=UPI00300C7E76
MMPHDVQEHSGEGDSECADLLESELNVSLKPLVVKAGQNGNVFTAKRRQETGDVWATVKQIVAAIFASLSSVSIGFITAYSSLTLPQLRNDTSIDYVDSRDSGWIGEYF